MYSECSGGRKEGGKCPLKKPVFLLCALVNKKASACSIKEAVKKLRKRIPRSIRPLVPLPRTHAVILILRGPTRHRAALIANTLPVVVRRLVRDGLGVGRAHGIRRNDTITNLGPVHALGVVQDVGHVVLGLGFGAGVVVAVAAAGEEVEGIVAVLGVLVLAACVVEGVGDCEGAVGRGVVFASG